jgi:zinc D-Ala-D-Ala dipeptidase
MHVCFFWLVSASPALAAPPKGFVELTSFIPGVRVDARYHTADNFTGAPLPGYGAPAAWMRREVAEALAIVHASLNKRGLGLLVYDGYRPRRGTLAMVAWAERTNQVALLDNGYIARRSGHNHGHTVDLTVCDLKTGEPVDMGTPWDTLTPASHTKNAKGKALEHRLLLKAEMQAAGFEPYAKEWWHFSFPLKGSVARDVPYGCFEAPEGRFVPPEGWSTRGFEMPASFPTGPCR